MTFSKNMIVRIKDGERYVNVILLYVTKKDLKKGINAISEGLYGFRGFWYKGNGTKKNSYGKIYDLSCYDDIQIIRKNIYGLKKKTMKKILC